MGIFRKSRDKSMKSKTQMKTVVQVYQFEWAKTKLGIDKIGLLAVSAIQFNLWHTMSGIKTDSYLHCNKS